MYYFVERMTEDDIEQVQAIERASFSTLWSANTYRHELRSPATSRYVVARASPTPPPPRTDRTASRRGLASLIPMLFGRQTSTHDFPIVGYGGVWLSVDEGHITTIAVAPAYRGRGIGELLLNELIDQALDMHADVLTLEVRVSNIVAQQLYLKYGFRPTGRRLRYYTDNGEDALIMSTEPIRSPAYQEKLRQLRERLFARLREEANEPAPLHNNLQPRIE
ncbi:MAG: ribosomal protein S18-alanine N-acetyltransferase [Roseiflexus sp.]|nr:ribosomal protein S18-alanine N-acetyltransferase [Roseiflexus sp.]MCS7289182.1 ribosomal protein S18-alanine N-acetyltransferase [Roseiflexus sp.]MDW8144775.1 ribosomal protein S18-alanine N-acetyltransferase [Roseiflexaceae bacterium]MDW8232183.1 ribosomal protein S18-alanine N-acetyltransferase [Roseiflexaceae bacterium]